MSPSRSPALPMALPIAACTPSDVVMLRAGQRQRAVFWPRPINHPNVLVSFRDAMNVQKTGSDQRARPGFSSRRTLSEQFHLEAALLPGFAQGRLLRVF